MKILSKIKSFIIQCRRVWLALKKPTKEEFLKVAKVAAVGIILLGFIGFAISLFMKLFVR
jgi:protein transport protein SEC61 subunit gamma-like protein